MHRTARRRRALPGATGFVFGNRITGRVTDATPRQVGPRLKPAANNATMTE